MFFIENDQQIIRAIPKKYEEHIHKNIESFGKFRKIYCRIFKNLGFEGKKSEAAIFDDDFVFDIFSCENTK